ncbi:flagellar filament capping protein FliD [Sphingosinicella sp.]|uniref:flagellar filament capping protein FliD n=1 Tax=Sphingosinicella sp. TaxID=1917971 RepID=UPI0040376953
MAGTSIGYQLGIGSGLDVKSLVDNLAAAAKAPKQAQIARREEANAARVSQLALVSQGIDGFASALSSLISGGTLFSQPSLSDPGVLSATAIPGARLSGLSASIEVTHLAQAQTLSSVPLPARTDPVGQGDLTLVTATGSFIVSITAANDSLDGLAKAINDVDAGVTASVVTDIAGARLVLKGATGAANVFTLSVPVGTSSGLERFAFGPGVTGGMTEALEARNAALIVDGVPVERATNSFDDLIAGVRIELRRGAPGVPVAMGVSRPDAAIAQAMGDFVTAYNELINMVNSATAAGVDGEGGVLRGDLGVREMRAGLARLPTMTLSSEGDGPHTLAEIGVRTNRDGSLSLDSSRLASVLASDPDGVEALFNPGQRSSSALLTINSLVGKVKPGTYTVTNVVPGVSGGDASGEIDGLAMLGAGDNLVAPAGSAARGLILGVGGAVASATITIDAGLGGALQLLRDSLRAANGPFTGSSDRLAAEAKTIAKDRDALETRSEKYYNQLLASFTAMERQVSAFKATQSYLEQQVKMWTADRN